MATTLAYFMTPEDEVAFLRALEKHRLDVYPEVSQAGYTPFLASAENGSRLVEPAYYFALPAAGELVARVIRRGPHAGMLEVDEVRSPVFHFERSLVEDGELRSGRLWAELELLQDRQRTFRSPDLMRRVFEEIREWLRKRWIRSKPTGFFVGPSAARRAGEGLVLREAGRKGETVVPYR